MTHHVLDPATNTVTVDPDEVARQVVLPGRDGTTAQDPPKIIIAANYDGAFDDDEESEHLLWLHPSQALAIGKRLIDLATAAYDPERAATTFPVVEDTGRPHLAIVGEGSQ